MQQFIDVEEALKGKELMHKIFNGIKVFYTRDTYAGGCTFGQDYIRLMILNNIRPKKIFEFCSGAGFIGFSLLAHGACDELCLADINKEAVACCFLTIRENGLEDIVSLYNSDGLDGIPNTEKWDMVVGNPPHFHEVHPDFTMPSLLYLDEGWQLHSRFFETINKYLTFNGLILLQESKLGSTIESFRKMVEKNNLDIIHTSSVPYLNEIYYLGCARKEFNSPFK